MRRAIAGALAAAALAAGCVGAPQVVLVDHVTALEREAAGRFPKLELDLAQAGLAPHPAPFVRADLEGTGAARSAVEEEDTGDEDRLDALLRARCIGESLDGALVETRDTCAVKELPRIERLLDRANRDRRQIWEALRAQRPQRHADEVRRAWREVHLQAVVCGAQVQLPDGTWGLKKC
jgi:hypothetical protein